jgi:hypothetical protein
MSIERLPEDYLALIGGIVTQFNSLDLLVSNAIIALTGNDFMSLNAHAPFVKLQFTPKKAILDLLLGNPDRIPDGSPLDSYWDTLRLPLDEAYKDRNVIAHSTWDKRDGIVFRRRLRASKKVNIERVETNKDDLVQILVRGELCRTGMTNLVLYLQALRGSPQVGQNLNISLPSLPKKTEEE